MQNLIKMLKLPNTTRDQIVQIIKSSNLPTIQGFQIISVLSSLEEIKPELVIKKEKDGK